MCKQDLYFKGQYSMLLQYEIPEKLVTYMFMVEEVLPNYILIVTQVKAAHVNYTF